MVESCNYIRKTSDKVSIAHEIWVVYDAQTYQWSLKDAKKININPTIDLKMINNPNLELCK